MQVSSRANNRIGNLIVEEAFNLWTDGKVGAYVRFVVDGQRFGFHPETEIAAREVRLGDDVYVCPDCGAETPAKDADGPRDGSVGPWHAMPGADAWQNDAHASRSRADMQRNKENQTAEQKTEANGTASPSSIAGHGMPCPYQCSSCGALLTEEDFVAAETITVPAAETRLRVPTGQEVITIVGGLELKTPPWAGEMHEYPYLQWNMEVHQARLRAAYPHAADKIGAPVASGMQEYERLARLAQSQGGALTGGGDSNMNLITFQRTWLRPWAFFALDDKSLRDELLQLFPDGAYVALAGDVYCESRNENMDDHWRVLHALPGDGSSGRPALGDVLISVQERFNTLSNLQMETYEYGIPPIYADSEVLDFDSLHNQSSEPGVHYPARAKPGQSLASGFFQPAPAEVPPRSFSACRQSDGTNRAISYRRISRAFRRLDDEHGHRRRLLDGARPGHGPHRPGLASHEILSRGPDAARRGLFPPESPERCGGNFARRGRGVRIEMDSPRGPERQSLQLSGDR